MPHRRNRLEATRGRRLTSGFEQLELRIQPAALPLITEVMAANSSTIEDEDGGSPDWIELYNAGDATLPLAGWHLTDDPLDLEMWTFPAVSLEPGEFLLVFASDKNRADADGTELHTNFKLGSSGDYLALVESNGASIAFEYAPTIPSLGTDVSYGLAMNAATSILVDDMTPLTYHIPANGTLGTSWTSPAFDDSAWNGATGAPLTAGIGFENSPADYDDFIDTAIPTGTGTFYSRFDFNVADPATINTLDLGMIYDDDFVAYLNGVKIAASDAAPEPPLWNSTSGQQRSDSIVIEDYVHFDVSTHAGLIQAGNNVLAIHGINTSSGSSDMLIIPQLAGGTAGVETPYTFGFFSQPTPGTANGLSFDGFVGDTSFSVDRGFYTSPVNVAITTPTSGATIVYTLDGSEPTVNAALAVTNGQLYSSPVTISETGVLRAAAFKTGFEATNIDTQTYIFADDVIDQDFQHALDLGMPANWGSNAADYGINVKAGHESDFTSALTAIPTISLVTDADNLFNSSTGIYTKSTSHGKAWERAASMELIYPDGTIGFQEDAGLRIQGGAFRNYGLTPKNSFRLAFRGEYGVTKLNYPLFGEDNPTEFDNLILRMESNDGWQWSGGNSEKLFARDQFGRETQLAMGQPAPHGTRMHVYLNGHYWGLYNPVERPDEGFAETYYGGDKDDYDVIKSGEIQEGSSAAWNTLKSLSQSVANGASEQVRTERYMQVLGRDPDGTPNAAFPVYLDATNYVDYMITNLYGGNSDWPQKNYAMVRDRTAASEGFKFMMWDSEWSLGLNSSVSVNRLNDFRGIAEPYGDLRSSEEFRQLFADRVHRHFFNDGVLTAQNARERFDSVIAEVEPGLWGESGRWGDQHSAQPKNPVDHWAPEVTKIRNNYLPQRSQIVLNQFISAGLYSSVAAVTWNQRGGTVSPFYDVALSAPQGTIYYTTDGSDPREIGGGINPNAILYSNAFKLLVPTTVKARVLLGSTWSAIDEAAFVSTVPSAEQTHLRVTEIHYHPANPDAAEQGAGYLDDGQFEFVELTNTSPSTTIDLANVAITDGIAATYSSVSQPLPPGGRALLISDLDAFTYRYGQDVVAEADYVLVYEGRLNNNGEQIQLSDAFGQEIMTFTYQDGADVGEEAWETSADGKGRSLIIVDPNGDASNGANWTGSAFAHGTPGTSESDRLLGDYDRDQDVDDNDGDLWEAQFGATNGIGLFADGNVNGIVDAADYTIWRDNLDAVLALATSARVPRAAVKAAAPVEVGDSSASDQKALPLGISSAVAYRTVEQPHMRPERISLVDLVFGLAESDDEDDR